MRDDERPAFRPRGARDGADETVRLVTEAGGRMTSTAPMDAADPDAVTTWVHQAAAADGRIDVLVNDAAGVR